MKLLPGTLYELSLTSNLKLVSAVWSPDETRTRGKQPNNVELWIRMDGNSHPIAIIDKQTPYIKIGLKFDAGETVTFSMVGKGQTYLSGYVYDKVENNGVVVSVDETVDPWPSVHMLQSPHMYKRVTL